MALYNFGVGTAIGRRTDVANATPGFMGVLQDIEIDFEQTLKELIGQYKVAVDVAPANLKITGKAKFARIMSNSVNSLFFGQTLTKASGDSMAVAEAQSVPATSTYTITATQAATFQQDLGVFYANTGLQLSLVTSVSAAGQYSVNNTTGVYTFDSADAGAAVLLYYRYGITTSYQVSVANQLMGVGPSFELNLQESYTNNSGTTGTIFVKLNACRSSKLTMPMKNTEYTVPEFDFQAFADSSLNIGLIAFSE